MDMLRHYFPLCWFRNHPLQLPGSVAFFRQNLIFYFIIEFFTQANMIPPPEAFFEVIMDISLTVLFAAVILSLNRSMHNYIQVATAILFCENIVAIIAVPVIVWLTVTHDWLSYTMLVGLVIWNFAIITYLMGKVLAIDILAGAIVAFFYFATTYGAAYALTLLI